MSSGLNLLGIYSSGDDSESEAEEIENGSKIATPLKGKLPVPYELRNLKKEKLQDDPSRHEGRKRTFPHDRGNWSSHVYVPYEVCAAFDIFCEQISELCLPEIELKTILEPHISLSRTFVLFYHWINEFHSSLSQEFKVLSSFNIIFDGLKVYCNEELTRTFLALTVGLGNKELSQAVQCVDKCLNEYNLQPFYQEASLHMSIMWCLGDQKKRLEERLPEIFKLFQISKEDPIFNLSCRNVIFKSGFKEFILKIS